MAERGVFRIVLAGVLTMLVVFCRVDEIQAQFLRHMNAHQLLRASSVYHVVGDKKRFLWFCTDRGLVKYDGREARFYTRQQGLGDDMVFNIYEDRQGRIWPFCHNGRYCYIDGDSIHNEQTDLWLAALPHGLGFIKCMAQDTAGNLQFGYSTHSVFRMRKGAAPQLEQHIPRLNTLIYDEFHVRYQDQLAALSVLARDRVHRLQADREGLRIFRGEKLVWSLDNIDLTQYTVNDLYLTDDGRLMVSTNRGLDIVTLKTGARQHLLDELRVSSCHPDDAGHFWITTVNNGIYRLHREGNNIRRLHGFDGLDFSVVNDGKVVFVRDKTWYDLLIAHDSITAIPFVDGITSYQSPLFRSRDWSVFQESWRQTPRLISKTGSVVNRTIIHMGLPDQDHLFFKRVYSRGDTCFFMYGTWHAYQFRRVQNELRFVGLLDMPTNVEASCQDPATGEVYLAFSGSIFRYDFQRKMLDTLITSAILKEPASMTIVDSSMLILSYDRQLYELPLKSADRRLRRHEVGFPVRSLAPYGSNRLFVSADNSDYLAELRSGRITAQPIRYPFVAPEYERQAFVGHNCLLKIDGQYYYFDTTLFNRQSPQRSVYVKKLVINGRDHRGDTIDIHNTTRLNIQISVGMLDFSGESVGIRYRLLGAGDTSWEHTTAFELAFVLRKAGTYQLQFAPSETPGAPVRSIRIVVHTPFLRSWGFFALCSLAGLLAIAGIVIAVLRYRRRHFDREFDYLRLEHRAINALLNPHFIFNSINNIQGLINESEKHAAAEYLAVLSRLIRQNLENLEFNLIPLEKELALIERYIRLQNLRFGGVLQLTINLTDDALQSVEIPPLLLHTFVENAIVHGFRSGDNPFVIAIDVRPDLENHLLITIRDNGVGIAPGAEAGTPGRRSMGISFNRKRLARLSEFYKLRQSIGLRRLSDQEGPGTEVRVVIYAGLKGLLERRRTSVH